MYQLCPGGAFLGTCEPTSFPQLRRAQEPALREAVCVLSGGMRQRVVGAIAMAGGGPKLIIADEPTTNLDVTIQAQYLEVLKDIQQKSGVALIFVTHNLGIVAKMCDKMAVMYAGKIVEYGAVRDLFRDAKDPYTQALLGSMPKLGSKEPLFAIPGQPPNLAQLPPGCAFQPRCAHAMPRCATQEPDDRYIRIGRRNAGLVDQQAKEQYVSAIA
jgi:oligopeptide/dipeptide ABC transporter ATP-binding protein